MILPARVAPEKVEFHSLKHSITARLLDAGADLATVQRLAGPADIQNTTIHARLTSTARDAQARKLFASHRVM